SRCGEHLVPREDRDAVLDELAQPPGTGGAEGQERELQPRLLRQQPKHLRQALRGERPPADPDSRVRTREPRKAGGGPERRRRVPRELRSTDDEVRERTR